MSTNEKMPEQDTAIVPKDRTLQLTTRTVTYQEMLEAQRIAEEQEEKWASR